MAGQHPIQRRQRDLAPERLLKRRYQVWYDNYAATTGLGKHLVKQCGLAGERGRRPVTQLPLLLPERDFLGALAPLAVAQLILIRNRNAINY